MNKLPKPYYDRDGITLYCGDSRKIMPLLPSSSVDMIFTDPPYGHNNNNGDLIHRWEVAIGKKTVSEKHRPIANDGAEANDLFRNALPEFARLLKRCCCCCCCCGGGGPDPQFARWSLWIDEVLNFKQMIVWDKGKMGMGWHYRRSYETVLVSTNGKGKARWFDDSNKVENIIRPGDYGIKKQIPTAKDHPTPKPIALPSHFIGLHSEASDLILDPFAGGGSTLVAARRMNRRAIGIECSKDFCRLIVSRLKLEGIAA